MLPKTLVSTLLSLAIVPSPTLCAECGKWFSSDCLADSDIRYDQDASNALEDQAEVWSKLSGFYRRTSRALSGTGVPFPPVPYDPEKGLGPGPRPYSLNPSFGFINITNVRSRRYDHRYVINPPPSSEFCDQEVPPGFVNVVPGGTCGVTGFAMFTEAYSTTTYEKDGSTQRFAVVSTLAKDLILMEEPGAVVPVDDKTVYGSVRGDTLFVSETHVCIDSGCNQVNVIQDAFVPNQDGQLTLVQSTRMELERIDSEAEFVAAINEAYQTYNVPLDLQVPAPMLTPCLSASFGGTCPTDTDFCRSGDPDCSESIYQEPEATVRAGPIVGIVAATFVVILVVAFIWHQENLAKQAERNRVKFARRVAETIRFHSSTRQLSPDALAEEFKEISKSSNEGCITKESLKDFMKSGKMGEMNDSDFEALFAVLDIDNSGQVDFLEFCTFVGQCNEEFDKAKVRPSVIAARRASRDDFAVLNSIARSVSQRSGMMKAVEEEGKAGEEKNEAEA